ncbi:MAG: methyltransferase family protein [Candidatus Latescibacterota bacterium]
MPKIFRVLAIALYAAVLIGGPLFLAADRFNLPFFWGYLEIWLLFGVVVALIPNLKLPLVRGGMVPDGTDGFLRVLIFPVLLVHWIIAGLDVGRFHWSDTVFVPLQVIGLVIMAAGFTVIAWSYGAYLVCSSLIGIRVERRKKPMHCGPYRYVRHPGYTGALAVILSSGAALGSWLSWLPALAGAALILYLAYGEDRFRQINQAGYEGYAREVPYRLIPGIW